MFMLSALDHFVLTVASIEKSAAFYESIGMRRVKFGEGRVGVAFGPGGAQRINFHEVGQVIQPRAGRATVGSGDFCLSVVGTMDEVVDSLKKAGVSVEVGPVERNGSRGKMQSVYVRDPDNNLVELAVYPNIL